MMLSVIVPVYKVESFLKRCIDSIVNQTYKNLEIILVDDGSPDNCGKICDEYARLDSRIKVVHKDNGGLSSARNAGLDIMTGEYFAFVDSDDWLDPDMYDSLMKVAVDTNADIVTGGYRFYRPWKIENQVLDGDYNGSVSVLSNIDALNMLYFGSQMFCGIPIMVWTKLYKTSTMGELRFCEGYINEDAEYTPRALYLANKVAKLDKSMYNYNIHLGADSTSGMPVSIQKIQSPIEMRRRTYEYFKGERYIKGISEHVELLYYVSLINGYYECWKRKNDKVYLELKNQIIADISPKKDRVLKIMSDWKTKLFFLSQNVYCTLVWLFRWLKKMKYKLRVLLTGKN